MDITQETPELSKPTVNPQAAIAKPKKRKELNLPWEKFEIQLPSTAEFVRKELQAQEMDKAISLLEFESLKELFPILGQKGKLEVSHNGAPIVSIHVGDNISKKPCTPHGLNTMAAAYRAVADLTTKATEQGVMQISSKDDFSLTITKAGKPLSKFEKPETDSWKPNYQTGQSMKLSLAEVRTKFPNTFKLIYCKNQKNHLDLKLGTEGLLRAKVVKELHDTVPKNVNLCTKVNGYADVVVTPFKAIVKRFPDTPEWQAKLKEAREAPGKAQKELIRTQDVNDYHTFYVAITQKNNPPKKLETEQKGER